MNSELEIAKLETILGHSFASPVLLETALTHRSYANEGKGTCTDNERLEFLGDAVLDLVIGHHLMEALPDLSEGELSMTRARMVSEPGLCKVAKKLGLGAWLLLGKGEERSGGREKTSILADMMEAVVAAIYLDGGLESACTFVLAHFDAPSDPGLGSDHKTRLQEVAQRRFHSAPVYLVVGESGPDHAKVFEVSVTVDGIERSRAEGRSKKSAEQEAADLALKVLADI